MEIRIKGKFDHSTCTEKELGTISWIEEGFVFVDYLDEDVFLGDVFVLEDGTEISLQKIKL